MFVQNTLPFEEETTVFADLILPVPIPKLFTYRVARIMSGLIKVGAVSYTHLDVYKRQV